MKPDQQRAFVKALESTDKYSTWNHKHTAMSRKIEDLITNDKDKTIENLKEFAEKQLERSLELNSRLQDGRHYLMSVEPDDMSIEDALESLGFGRNGLSHTH